MNSMIIAGNVPFLLKPNCEKPELITRPAQTPPLATNSSTPCLPKNKHA